MCDGIFESIKHFLEISSEASASELLENLEEMFSRFLSWQMTFFFSCCGVEVFLYVECSQLATIWSMLLFIESIGMLVQT